MNTKETEKPDGELVVIAKLIKPKGLRGELVADVLTDFLDRFENLETVLTTDEAVKELQIERFYFQKNRIVLKFKSIDTIEQADELRGIEIGVAESDAVELEEGEYFDWELEGCSVETADGEKIGVVKELFRAGENINLIVDDGKKDYMIPFVEAICTEVDTDAKKILVELPEGLLEL